MSATVPQHLLPARFARPVLGIRVNTFANSRTAFASLRGKPFPTYEIPLSAGMSIGTMLISTELLLMLAILLFIPGDLAGSCFIGFAIGESLGESVLGIAGGLLAAELAIELPHATSLVLAAAFFTVSVVFVYRSFCGMRIEKVA
jgi:hypothetical protein